MAIVYRIFAFLIFLMAIDIKPVPKDDDLLYCIAFLLVLAEVSAFREKANDGGRDGP
jgi:hypothetical protein